MYRATFACTSYKVQGSTRATILQIHTSQSYIVLVQGTRYIVHSVALLCTRMYIYICTRTCVLRYTHIYTCIQYIIYIPIHNTHTMHDVCTYMYSVCPSYVHSTIYKYVHRHSLYTKVHRTSTQYDVRCTMNVHRTFTT